MKESLGKAVIAGGTGLIGTHLVAELLRRGVSVSVLSRTPSRAQLPEGAVARGYDELEDALEGADVVFNLAGASIAGRRWSKAYKHELIESRVGITARIVEAIVHRASKPKALVNASAIGWYGPRDQSPIGEDASQGDSFLSQLCGDWESAADRAAAAGVRVVKLRTGVVLAREGGALPRMAFPVRIFQGAKLGSGEQGFSWIHIEDLVALYLQAAEDTDWSGAVNATAPGPVSNAAFTRLLGRKLHRPILPVPGFVTAAALKILVGGMSVELLEGAYILPRRAEELGFVFRFPTADAALGDLL